MAGVRRRVQAGSLAVRPETPPICGRPRITKASTIVPVMASTNWKASVTATPHIPETAEYAAVTTSDRATYSMTCRFGIPNMPSRIEAMARFTQPQITQFMKTPR